MWMDLIIMSDMDMGVDMDMDMGMGMIWAGLFRAC